MAGSYSPDERRALEAALAAGDPLRCPVCGAALARHEVKPKAELPYVRRRVLLICPGCKRSASVDAPRRRPGG